jgi:hypothetical protein
MLGGENDQMLCIRFDIMANRGAGGEFIVHARY